MLQRLQLISTPELSKFLPFRSVRWGADRNDRVPGAHDFFTHSSEIGRPGCVFTNHRAVTKHNTYTVPRSMDWKQRQKLLQDEKEGKNTHHKTRYLPKSWGGCRKQKKRNTQPWRIAT